MTWPSFGEEFRAPVKILPLSNSMAGWLKAVTSALIGAEAAPTPSEQLLTAAFTGDVELAAALLDTQPQPASNNGCFAPIHAATQNGHTQASAVCHGPPRPHTVSLPHCLALLALTLSRSTRSHAVSLYLVFTLIHARSRASCLMVSSCVTDSGAYTGANADGNAPSVQYYPARPSGHCPYVSPAHPPPASCSRLPVSLPACLGRRHRLR